MPDRPLSMILRRLRPRDDGAAGQTSDDRLLERFALRHEETAFADLMGRHGPMVLSVCRRVLPRAADVEDAFQATFMTLVRKAGSIRKQSSVAGWLYRVAYHAAIRTKADAARRQAREQPRPPTTLSDAERGGGTGGLAARDTGRQAASSTRQPSAEASWRELQEVLDEELGRLPEKYRAPIVLCYMEGKTHEEAAGQLGWPPGTVKGRLARARDLLRARLTRRGLGPVAGSFATVLAVNTPIHAVPGPLAVSATRTALLALKGLAVAPRVAALVEGLTRTLLVSRLKTLAAVVLACCLFGLAIVGGALLARELWDISSPLPPGSPSPDRRGGLGREVADPIAPLRPASRVALDRFGDPLPREALARMGTVRLRMGSPVYSFAYSRDGQMLAAGGDRSVFLWKADTGAEVVQLTGHENRVLGVAFSPDGRTLASSSADRTIRLWHLGNGKEIRRLEGHQATVGVVVFSPDGRRLVSGSADKTLRLWDMANGEELRRLGDGLLPVATWPIAFLPDDRTVATRDLQGTLRFWDASTGEELRRDGLPQRISALAFSADGLTVAAARPESASVQLFELATGKELHQLNGHRGAIDSLAFSPDGKILASSGADRTLRFWEVSTAKELRQAETGQQRHAGLAFSPDGATLAVGWDTMLRLWDAGSGTERAVFAGHRGQVRCVAFLPDGRTICSTGTDKTVRCWDMATGQEQGRWDGPVQDPAALAFAFAPDGRRMASGSIDFSIHLRDRSTGQLVHQCRGHKGFISGLAFTSDGRTLASASWDRSIALWDVATGQELGRLEGHAHEIMSVAFSPDGKLLASGSTDGTLRIWDTETGKTLHQCGGDLGWIRSVAFSPDGKIVAAAGGVHASRGKQGLLSLWEVATGQERSRWEAHAERAYCVTFSPDGTLLATGGGDHLIRLWKSATGKELPLLQGHRGAVVSLAFSPDGRHLASGSMDTTALVWPVPGQLLGSGKATGKQ